MVDPPPERWCPPACANARNTYDVPQRRPQPAGSSGSTFVEKPTAGGPLSTLPVSSKNARSPIWIWTNWPPESSQWVTSTLPLNEGWPEKDILQIGVPLSHAACHAASEPFRSAFGLNGSPPLASKASALIPWRGKPAGPPGGRPGRGCFDCEREGVGARGTDTRERQRIVWSELSESGDASEDQPPRDEQRDQRCFAAGFHFSPLGLSS